MSCNANSNAVPGPRDVTQLPATTTRSDALLRTRTTVQYCAHDKVLSTRYSGAHSITCTAVELK